MEFIVWEKKDGQFYWRIVSSNGKTLCTSEPFTRKDTAMKSVENIKKNASNATVRDKTK